MKNKLLIIVILCLFLAGCGVKLTVSKMNIDENDDVYITIDDISNTSLTYTVYNNTDEELYYGAPYYIEIYKNNKWYSYDISASWIEIAYVLSPNSTNSETIDFSGIYGELKTGTYRFIKDIGNYTISCQFEIV